MFKVKWLSAFVSCMLACAAQREVFAGKIKSDAGFLTLALSGASFAGRDVSSAVELTTLFGGQCVSRST
jgi:hypothetical protein